MELIGIFDGDRTIACLTPTRQDDDEPGSRRAFIEVIPSAMPVRLSRSIILAIDPLAIGNAYPIQVLLNGISSLVPVSNSAHEPAQTACTATR